MNEVYEGIEQHIPQLKRYARAITRNPETADDLVQESLLKALTKSHLYKPGTNLRAWLFTILHNQHVSDMRCKARVGVPIDPDDAAPAIATRPNQEAGVVMDRVERELNRLPDEQRTLIELVALEGRSYKDVAQTFDLTLGTVKSRIARGRIILRNALEGQYEGEYDSYDSMAPSCSRPLGSVNNDDQVPGGPSHRAEARNDDHLEALAA